MIHRHRWVEETRNYQPPPPNLSHHQGTFDGQIAAYYGITVVQMRCSVCDKPKTEILLGRADFIVTDTKATT